MPGIKHHLKRVTSKDYEHRQYVVLSAVIGILLLAFAFNSYILNRSVILLTITQPGVEVMVDGSQTNLERVDDNTYRLVTIPGKHTVTITAEGSINHKEVIQTRAATTTAVTPALTIAPNPASEEIGTVNFLAQSKDKQYLYYLGQNGKTLVRYRLEDGSKTAISDPVFHSIADLSWAPDFNSVIVKNNIGNWYTFDFRKADFINSQFINLANPTFLDIAYDPQASDGNHDRVGYIEYRDNTPVFGIATPGLANPEVLSILKDLKSPRLSWAPNGAIVALLEDTSYTKNNLLIYNLATDNLSSVPNVIDVTSAWFNEASQQLLVFDASNGLSLHDTESRETKKIAELVANGAASWLDNDRILAVLKEENGSALVELDITGRVLKRYSNSPALTSAVTAFFTDSQTTEILFVLDNNLYTFPLIEQPLN